MEVRDLMSELVFVARMKETLNEAMSLMWQHDVGCLPVLDDANHVAGVVTDRDVARAAFEHGRRLADINVAEVMSHPAHTVGQDHPVGVAARLMRENRIRRLPVVDGNNHPIGILSLDDLALALAQDRLGPGVSAEEIAETLHAVAGAPRKES